MKEQLEKYLIQIDEIGGDCQDLIFERPAKVAEILAIEKELKYKIPSDFRNILLTISSHCEFKWVLPDKFPLPEQLSEIFCGEIHWGTDFIIQFNENKDDWVKEVFSDIGSEYDKVWHNKFVFQEVGNGDYLSIDLNSDTYGKIVYLSHDDGEGHGFIMANSFSDLLKNWTKLGCVGGEDWQWLTFFNEKFNGIDPNCENAKLWYKTIGIE